MGMWVCTTHLAICYLKGVDVIRKEIFKSQSNAKMKVALLSLMAKLILYNPEYKGTMQSRELFLQQRQKTSNSWSQKH